MCFVRTQEETTSDIQENEKTATQNQEETKPVEEAGPTLFR